MKEINYYDDEEVIKAFWTCNIKQDYEGFDFIQAFTNFEGLIYRKLSEHGILEYDDYKECEEELFDYSCLEQFEQCTDYIQITKEDLIEAITKYKYEKNKDTFAEGYASLSSLKDIYDKIQTAKCGGLSRKENVFLFDEVIHAEHETGLIFDDLEIEKLREEFEKGVKE